MKIVYDETSGVVTHVTPEGDVTYPLDTAEAFELISRAWLRASWDIKYPYSFTWFGRPIIQLPEDIVRIQEVIWQIKPDFIIETGVAHGGSLMFYASLLKAMGLGGRRVIGVELELRPHNRKLISEHPLSELIDIVDGSSIDPAVVAAVGARIPPGAKVLVVLDSNHRRAHVLAELEAYSRFVSIGSYIVATDGIMEIVVGAPRTSPEWAFDNPKQAALDFVAKYDDFCIEEPAWLFNEGGARERISYWPSAYIKRIR